MVNTARALFDWHRQTAQRFIQDSTDWVVEEKRWIISRQEFSRFASEVTQLRDAVARLEARLARHT
jgi:ubiquinone biosynthesis protein UbiJ